MMFMVYAVACAVENPMLISLTKASSRPGIVIDVGANGGQQTSMALNANRRVVAVECLADAYSSLLAKFIGNDNVTLIHACAGAQTKMATLHLADDSSSLFEKNIKHGSERRKAAKEHNMLAKNRQSVIVVSLDELISEPVAFIKIDTQGFEYEVLRGSKKLLQAYAPIVMYENDKRFVKSGDPRELLPNYDCVTYGMDIVCVPR